jgi:hypothetical protein
VSSRATRGAHVLAIVVVSLILLAVLPDTVFAFGPATHVYLGQHLLNNLHFLPQVLADLIRVHPQSFLYGSMAADISFAKKYVPAGRHCHFWHVGEEILERANNDRLRAVAFGYLSHLAADTVAHNFFVPRQLLLTSSSKALGHSYWEHRMDTQLGETHSTVARDVVMEYDHSEADNLFDRVLSGTIFSFETNRRIFRGMIRVQDNDRWRAAFDRVLQKSRWDLTNATVDAYISLSFDFVVDYLLRRRESHPATFDPTGEFNLGLAKKVRRLALRERTVDRPGVLQAMADDFFPLPRVELTYWTRSTITSKAG